MNKGGTGGPTAAAAQKQKSLQSRLDIEVGSIIENFNAVANVARVTDPRVGNSQEAFMMEVRTVQSGNALSKLVSELKQTAIFSVFASLNNHVEQRTKTDRILARIGEDAAASLKQMESHYYSSLLRSKSESKSKQHHLSLAA